MTTRYEPTSDFLKAVIADDIPLSGSPFADANMRRLIALTQDDDLSNRDWATMLLAQDDADTWEVRQALLAAVADPDAAVRAEALAGLALRDPSVALPFVIEALSGDCVPAPVFEAAATIAARRWWTCSARGPSHRTTPILMTLPARRWRHAKPARRSSRANNTSAALNIDAGGQFIAAPSRCPLRWPRPWSGRRAARRRRRTSW